MNDMLMPAWHTFLALLGIGFLIFIHELGHFVAAKRCGIRVDTFCLGFQPTVFGFRMRLFAFRHGQTEYVIGMIPFGGYVKMAGEEITDERTGSDDEYASKPPWQRAIVLVAGATMNIVFAFVAFIIAFAIGVPFIPSEVGEVVGGGPAWNAGLRAGDRIVEVDGRPVTDFMEMRTSLALGGLREIPVMVERDSADGVQRVELGVTPRKSKARGMPLTAMIASSLLSEINEVGAGTAAAEAGLETGDRILGLRLVSGHSELELPESVTGDQMWELFNNFQRRHDQVTVSMRIERDGEPARWIQFDSRPRSDEALELRRLGAFPEQRMIALVDSRSAAAAEFKSGEEIVALAGETIYSLDAVTVADAAAGRDTIEYRTAAGRVEEVETTALIEWLFRDLVPLRETIQVASVTPESPAAELGLAPGDRLLTIDGMPADLRARGFFGNLEEYLNGGGKSLELTWHGAGGFREGTLASGRAAGMSLHSPLVVGLVHPGSGAHAAGLEPGDILRQVNGQKLTRWGDWWVEVNRARKAGEERVKLVFERAHETQEIEVEYLTHGMLAGVNFARTQIIVSESGFDAVVLGCDRAVLWGKRVFLTVRALVRREVALSNLSGPVGIINVTKMMIAGGWGRTLFILALISLNLGIFNLFPFPILDGGHLVFLGIEKIKGSPVNEKFQYYAHLVAFVLLISLALFVTYHDIDRWSW